MSSKKKRIARGLGASALAVATVVSGLSLGLAPANAAGEYIPTYFTTDVTGTYDTADSTYVHPAIERGAIFSLGSTVYGNKSLTQHSSVADAEAKASRFTKLSGSWGQWRNSSGQCAGIFGNGRNTYAISVQSCNNTSAQQWRFVDGKIQNREWPNSHFGYAFRASTNDTYGFLTAGSQTADAGGEYAQKRLTAAGSFPADRTQRAQIAGTGEAGATVVFKMGMVEAGRVTADATDGSYTWDVPAPMQGGTKSYTVSQIVDGTESGNVQVDLNYGTAVSISSPTDGAPANAGTTQITGRGENGSAVTVAVNGTNLTPVTVTNGTWTAQADLRRGENTITATQSSKGANSTTTSITVNPGESNTRPFEVTSPSNNDTVGGPTVEFEGKAELGTTVRILEGSTLVMSQVTTGTDENWSGASGNLSNGLHRLTVEYTEPGQTTPQTQPLNITVSTGVVRDFNWATPTGRDPLSRTFTVTGEATTGTRVNLIYHNANGSVTVMDTIPTNDQGVWSGVAVAPEGTRQYTLQYLEPGKGKQTITRTLDITADQVRPFEWNTPDGSAPLSQTFSVTGMATPKTQVNLIYRNASGSVTVMDTIPTNDQGVWSGVAVAPEGTRQYTLQYLEPGKGKQQISRTLEIEPSQVVPVDWTTPDGTGVLAERFTVSGTAPANTLVNLIYHNNSGSVTVMDTIPTNDQGNWSGVAVAPSGTREYTLQYKVPGKDKQQIKRTLEVEERTVVDFSLTSPTDGNTVDSTFEFRGKATTDTLVNVIRINNQGNPQIMDNVEANGKGDWSGSATLEGGRTHTVRIQYKEPGQQNKKTMDLQLTVR